MALPAELRLIIHHMALFSDEVAYTCQLSKLRIPPYLHVSRQLRLEAMPIYRDHLILHVYLSYPHHYCDALHPPETLDDTSKLYQGAMVKSCPDLSTFCGPLPQLTFRHVNMSFSDAEQCRLWQTSIEISKRGQVKLSLTLLSSSINYLAALEINAIELMPQGWRASLMMIFAKNEVANLDVFDLHQLADLTCLCYPDDPPHPYSKDELGGDDVNGGLWDVHTIDKLGDAVEDFSLLGTSKDIAQYQDRPRLWELPDLDHLGIFASDRDADDPLTLLGFT